MNLAAELPDRTLITSGKWKTYQREYLKYPAFIAQRSEEKGYLFPKIRICSNSMHSRLVVYLWEWLSEYTGLVPQFANSRSILSASFLQRFRSKMQRYYQQVNMTLIQAGIDRQPFSTILNFQMVSAKLRLFVETCPTELYGLGTLKLQLIASGTTKNRKSMPVTDNS